jgi:hypothetical protein
MSAPLFTGGSRHIRHVPEQVRTMLHRCTEQGTPVIVGDANGADKALQTYLAQRHYPHVTIYYAGTTIRTNVGGWPQISVPVPAGKKAREQYMVRDARMADDADSGLMLWDGKSAGTINNVLNLLERSKHCHVYCAVTRDIYHISRAAALDKMLQRNGAASCESLQKKTGYTQRIYQLQLPVQTSFLDTGHDTPDTRPESE